jgi:hypothetical protein
MLTLLSPREVPMPQQILDLRKEAFSYVPSDPGWRFLGKSDQCTVFRAAVKSGEITDAEEIISTALKLDNDLVQIFNNAPPGWMYETVYTDSDCPLIFDGAYDIYYDHWVAQIWNGQRCIRIGMNELVRSQLVKGTKVLELSFRPFLSDGLKSSDVEGFPNQVILTPRSSRL